MSVLSRMDRSQGALPPCPQKLKLATPWVIRQFSPELTVEDLTQWVKEGGILSLEATVSRVFLAIKDHKKIPSTDLLFNTTVCYVQESQVAQLLISDLVEAISQIENAQELLDEDPLKTQIVTKKDISALVSPKGYQRTLRK
jgi:hypothetical protein